jgi:hypothetical protein
VSESIIKLAAALPKGEGVNGFDDEVLGDDLWTAKIEGRSGTPRVAIIVYGVKEAKADKNGDRVVVVEALRVQPVKTEEGRRAVETLLLDEYVGEHGDILPFDVKHVTAPAFADLPRSTDEVDQEEERERETMSPHDELRRHLERVHGRADSHLLTDGEADHRHEADHDGDLPGELEHERDWIGWTRADIEAATAESDGDPHAHEDDSDQLPLGEVGGGKTDGDAVVDAEVESNVHPLFSGTAN